MAVRNRMEAVIRAGGALGPVTRNIVGLGLFPARLNHKTHDRLVAERLARFQPMQAFHKDKALAVLANPYGGPLTFHQYTLGDFAHDLGIKHFLSLDRHIYVLNLEDLVLHQHGVKAPLFRF